jgi:broad specificity phosphatase PhoE
MEKSLQDLAARVSNVLRLVLDQHRFQTVVVVRHSAGNRALLLQTLDQPLSAYWRLGQDPCSVSEIEILQGPNLFLSSATVIFSLRSACLGLVVFVVS